MRMSSERRTFTARGSCVFLLHGHLAGGLTQRRKSATPPRGRPSTRSKAEPFGAPFLRLPGHRTYPKQNKICLSVCTSRHNGCPPALFRAPSSDPAPACPAHAARDAAVLRPSDVHQIGRRRSCAAPRSTQVSLAGGDRLRKTLSFFPVFFSGGRAVDAVLKRAGGALPTCTEATRRVLARLADRHLERLHGRVCRVAR